MSNLLIHNEKTDERRAEDDSDLLAFPPQPEPTIPRTAREPWRKVPCLLHHGAGQRPDWAGAGSVPVCGEDAHHS